MEEYEIKWLDKNNNEHKEVLIIRDENPVIRLLIKNHNMHKDGFINDFQLRELKEGVLRVSDMYIQNDAYKGIGLSAKLILSAKEFLNKTISSSSNQELGLNQTRSRDATKVWEKLKLKGLVRYEKEEDRYYTI